MYHAAQTQKFQFDLSLTSCLWMALAFNMLTESLGWYLEVSQMRSMSLYWLISIPNGPSARQSQTLKTVKHFDFDLTCVVISDPNVKKFRLPSTNSPDLSNDVCRPVVPEFWGGGKNSSPRQSCYGNTPVRGGLMLQGRCIHMFSGVLSQCGVGC